jgi:hypothetical protein
MAQQRASGLARAQSVGVPHNWGYDDDALLAALVVEYGYNWHFIADTCSSTCVLQVRACMSLQPFPAVFPKQLAVSVAVHG